MKQGYRKVYVYQEGFPEWQKAGHPVETLDLLPKVEIPAVPAAELKRMIDGGEGVVIVDIRDRVDLAAGRIKGSVHIPLDDFMARHAEIPKARKVVLVDRAGNQTAIAGRYLVKQGFGSVVALDKGVVNGWIAAGLPVEK